jgi:hypothetical protein
VKNPVTVPSIVPVPSGPEKRVCSGIVHVVVRLIGAALEEVSVSDIGLPPVGVNVKVTSNAVGTKTDVLPMTCAGVNSPLPFTTTVTGWPPQLATICVAPLARIGSAVETGMIAAAARPQPP